MFGEWIRNNLSVSEMPTSLSFWIWLGILLSEMAELDPGGQNCNAYVDDIIAEKFFLKDEQYASDTTTISNFKYFSDWDTGSRLKIKSV